MDETSVVISEICGNFTASQPQSTTSYPPFLWCDPQKNLVVGRHRFALRISGEDGPPIEQTLDIDVSGRYAFAVAIADLTLSGNSASGSIQPLAADDRYDDSFLVEGRLAFYLKGKIKGKYLVTAQADTQEREVSQLFSGFWNADPQDIFRRLDPDAYYPVYGDDSTTWRDVGTQVRLYVRVDWDKSQALWGNSTPASPAPSTRSIRVRCMAPA